MDTKLSHCFIFVDDHEKALTFYQDVLGFEVRQDVKFEGMRWLTVGPRSQPDVNIVLESPGASPDASAADRKVMRELLAKGLLRGVNLTTGDCDGTFERVRAAGGDVVQEPMDQPYGVRDCAFRDPAGNMIRIQQPRPAGRRR